MCVTDFQTTKKRRTKKTPRWKKRNILPSCSSITSHIRPKLPVPMETHRMILVRWNWGSRFWTRCCTWRYWYYHPWRVPIFLSLRFRRGEWKKQLSYVPALFNVPARESSVLNRFPRRAFGYLPRKGVYTNLGNIDQTQLEWSILRCRYILCLCTLCKVKRTNTLS